MSIIQIENVSRQFGDLSVLKNLSLNLDKSEVLGLLGHNGAGKTTTMKMILGLLKPSSGSVRVFGEDPFDSNFSHYRYRIGFLPENVSFYQQLSGLEVLQFFAKLKKVSPHRCIELLEKVGLTDAMKRKVKTYSKGMKQRLGLAQAVLTEPSLLLLDEPTVGLDPIATQEFYLMVDELKQSGCSIILCSHVLPGVEKHIDKVAILSKGTLVAHGSIQQLREETGLTTQLHFSGCFDMEKLSRELAAKVISDNVGGFIVEISTKDKIHASKILLAQPGLQNFDTLPPSLEQLYRHYIVGDTHSVIDSSSFDNDASSMTNDTGSTASNAVSNKIVSAPRQGEQS